MKYVYYDPPTMQIMAEFDTPVLSDQHNWVAKGYLTAVVPVGITATRDHRITGLDRDAVITDTEPSRNPEQPIPSPTTRLDDLHDKLAADNIPQDEVREMLRLERGP